MYTIDILYGFMCSSSLSIMGGDITHMFKINFL